MASRIPSDRRRALLMQAALCLVLAASLAVAAFVSRHQTRVLRVGQLTDSISVDGLTVSRPSDWTLVREEDGLLLQEPTKTTAAPRKLKIRYARSSIFMSPLEYLVRCGGLAAHEATALMDATGGAHAEVVKPITIAGWPGILLSQTRVMSGVDARQQMMWKRTLACAVMGGGDVLLLRLEGEGAATTTDEDLVRRIGESLKVNDREAPQIGGEVELAGGIRVPSQPQMLRGHESDPLRISRRLLEQDSGGWIGVDLVPCVVFPREKDQTLSAMMLLRDPQF